MSITLQISIMIDQHSKSTPSGIKTEFVREAQTDPEAVKRVIKVEAQQGYISLVIDESHYVKIWGNEFWIAFSEIDTIMSIFPQIVC